ncbi:hypothetical protein IW262DRAFT_1278736, partial [Armillaria fumosa]
KLCPKFIRPYKVEEAYPETSNYTLQLPIALKKKYIHLMFHVSLLQPYHMSNNSLFPNHAQPEPYDFGTGNKTEWFVDEVVGHRWSDHKLELQIRWLLGDTIWEPLSSCKYLAALD